MQERASSWTRLVCVAHIPSTRAPSEKPWLVSPLRLVFYSRCYPRRTELAVSVLGAVQAHLGLRPQQCLLLIAEAVDEQSCDLSRTSGVKTAFGDGARSAARDRLAPIGDPVKEGQRGLEFAGLLAPHLSGGG